MTTKALGTIIVIYEALIARTLLLAIEYNNVWAEFADPVTSNISLLPWLSYQFVAVHKKEVGFRVLHDCCRKNRFPSYDPQSTSLFGLQYKIYLGPLTMSCSIMSSLTSLTLQPFSTKN